MGGFTFQNLPGVQVQTVDGGLTSLTTPTTKSTIIIGTAGAGPVNTPYQVTNRNQAAKDFGNEGTLYKALCEVATYCDNILLYRIGTTPGTISGIGADPSASPAQPGFSITLGEVEATAGTDYQVWYNAGVLYLWLNGNLVYANDVSAGVVVDTGDSIVVDETLATLGTATVDGLTLGSTASGLAKTTDGALTLAAAAALTAANAPDYTAPDTGLGLSMRETYEALQDAYNLLTNFPVQQAFSPNVVLDTPNVAFYVSTDPLTAANNPVGNPDVLDWLKTTTDVEGNTVYQWATDTVDSAGNTVTPPTFASAEDRINQGFYEVNFGYQVARFAQAQSEVLGGCIGFIGTTSPARFDLPSIRTWIGYLPKYSTAGNPTAAGKGLLGIPYVTGTPSGKLNSLAADAAQGYRTAGFFQTENGEFDMGSGNGIVYDQNQNPIDIGAYLHVVGETALIVNNYGQYIGNIAGVVTGLHSSLDPKNALTNKQLTSTVQLYRASLGQLDALTQAKINMLRFQGQGQTPALLHDRSAANANSDYIFIIRNDIKFLVCQVIFNRGNKFTGQTSTDGLQMQAMQTAIDADLQTLQKAGYISNYSFTVTSTQSQQRLGQAKIYVKFNPADELVQLLATVGIQQN